MNKKAKKALKESIKHWERMRDNPECGEEPTSMECACCQSFDDCEGCPIMEYTDNPCCDETPYDQAIVAWHQEGSKSLRFKESAQAEIDFLNEVLANG